MLPGSSCSGSSVQRGWHNSARLAKAGRLPQNMQLIVFTIVRHRPSNDSAPLAVVIRVMCTQRSPAPRPRHSHVPVDASFHHVTAFQARQCIQSRVCSIMLCLRSWPGLCPGSAALPELLAFIDPRSPEDAALLAAAARSLLASPDWSLPAGSDLARCGLRLRRLAVLCLRSLALHRCGDWRL